MYVTGGGCYYSRDDFVMLLMRTGLGEEERTMEEERMVEEGKYDGRRKIQWKGVGKET